ncbi:MAG: hypothetical protein GY808_06460 [Gammaproteobacteria bacterium]|nr:hypothetical protein [Gammaproteobacteria bacterium]
MDSVSVQSASTNSEPIAETQKTNTETVSQSHSLKNNTAETKKQPQTKNRKFNCPSKTDEEASTQQEQLDNFLLHSKTPEVKQLLTITEYNPDKETRMSLGKLSKEDRKQRDNKRINKLALSMADFPNNKLLNFTLMNACVVNPENLNCSSTNIDKALALDGNNGALLSEIAAFYYKKGDQDTAISFLENSAHAPFFNDYRKEQLTLFVNALKPMGLPLMDITSVAVGLDPPMNLSIGPSLCLSDPFPEDIIQTCIAYGKRLESDGNTLIHNSIGLQIQKKIYKHFADITSLEEVDRKKKIYDQTIKDMIFIDQFFHDENFANDWLTTIINYNEAEAFKRMNIEAERLMADPDYTPCP